MVKKTPCLSILGFMFVLCLVLTGCGGPRFTYDGTYDEEVLRKLNQDITIEGQRISLPCTVGDMGENFSYQLYNNGSAFLIGDSFGHVQAYLQYKGTPVAQLGYALSYDQSHDYAEDPIAYINFFGQDTDWSVGGIVRGRTTMEEVVEQLGKPESSSPEEDGLIYDTERLRIYGNADGTVKNVWMTVNTDPEWENAPAAVYDGSWNEDTGFRLADDIMLGNRHMPMPFTVQDLGVGFSLDWNWETGEWYSQELPTSDFIMMALRYFGDFTGYVLYPAAPEPDHDYSVDPVLALCPAFNPRCSFTVAGMVPGSITEAQLSEKLGQPRCRFPKSFGIDRLIYGDQEFAAIVDSDGNVREFYLTDPTSDLLSIAKYQPRDTYPYDGTCTKETICHLGEAVMIQGVPCKLGQTVEELGEDFGLTYILEAKEPGELTNATLTLKGEPLISVYFAPGGEDHDYRRDPIQQIRLHYLFGPSHKKTMFFSAGPIHLFFTTMEEVKALLGEPEKEYVSSGDGSGTLYYCDSQLWVCVNEHGLVDEIFINPKA